MKIQCHSSSTTSLKPLSLHRHFCCFGADTSAADTRPSSCCSWLRSTPHNLPEIRDRCRRLIGRSHHRKTAGHGGPAEFRYDPLSYAMNFDDEWSRGDGDHECPVGSFMARLPATPQRREPANLKCVKAGSGLL